MIIESLTKAPFIVLFALSAHIAVNAPTPPTPREKRLVADDKILDAYSVAAIVRVSRAIATVDQDIS